MCAEPWKIIMGFVYMYMSKELVVLEGSWKF